MSCFAGIGAAFGANAAATAAGTAAAGVGAAGLGKAAFDYNRQNFMQDRDQRRRMELKVMKMRVAQASLWREDVRDLISLTEYKMHVYLLTNVLMLGFAITLWTEGKMSNGTPHWLMVGNIISICGAFMFLLLSIWLAMHAAVTAQSYEARLLTQMVRLPIPSWQEVESCRTFGSQFEQTEARQAFRVPFIMGSQEGLAKRSDDADESENADVPPRRQASNDSLAAFHEAEAERAAAFADPWGLERGGDGLKGLGCSLASQVGELRHVKLSRQAAAQWQTYDAFARISMSIGAQHLMFAMLYYVLGYMLVEVGCKIAATYGAVMFTIMAETIVKLDMSLSSMELRLAQLLLAIGPFFSTIAAHLWWDYATWSAEFLIPIAFLAHGSYLMLVAALCRVRVQGNGALLPVAFRSVLYLDVFGWLQGSREDHGGFHHPGLFDESNGTAASPPALQTFAYGEGGPSPTRPQDFCPLDSTEDYSDVQGAPDINRPGLATETRAEEFYQAASFVPASSKNKELPPMETGHERERPGILPWSVFCGAILILCAAWTFSAIYSVHGASTHWSLDLPESKDPRQIDYVEPIKPEADQDRPVWWPWVIGDPLPVDDDGNVVMPPDGIPRRESTATRFLQESRARTLLASAHPERIVTSWPYPDISPRHLACDASGTHFVVSDRVMALKAQLRLPSKVMLEESTDQSSSNDMRRSNVRGSALRNGATASVLLQRKKTLKGKAVSQTAHASFEELDCPAILGEGLEDTAVVCNASSAHALGSCEALVLHRHGQRLAACGLNAAAEADFAVGENSEVVNVSASWLEKEPHKDCNDKFQRRGPNAGMPSKLEKPRSLTVNPQCMGLSGARSWECAVLGTTHGRVVQLGWRSQGEELIPTDSFTEGHQDAGHQSVRAVGSRYLGVLHKDGRSIQLLDLKNGGFPSGKLALPEDRPASAFCVGGGYVYTLSPNSMRAGDSLLQEAPSELWRIPLPPSLLQTMDHAKLF